MSSPKEFSNVFQSVDWKLSLRISSSPSRHFLNEPVVVGYPPSRGLYRGDREIRLWSDFLSGGRGDAVCASLIFA